MSEIRRADKADIPAMTEIWIDSFGDSGEYVGRFMDERLPSSAALVLSDEGTVMSQLFLLPGEMSVSEKRQPALYLYAAATRPDGRGRGYMSLLIEAAKDYAEKNGFAYIALVPGEDGLYDYYSRFGFYEAFGYRLLRKSRSGLQKAAGARSEKLTMTSASMTAVRNKCLSGADAFIWDENAVSFAVSQHSLGGGLVLCTQDAWALLHEENGTAKVTELCAGEKGFGEVAAALLDDTDAEYFEFRVPQNSLLGGGEPKRGGMIFETVLAENSERISNAYIGLTME